MFQRHKVKYRSVLRALLSRSRQWRKRSLRVAPLPQVVGRETPVLIFAKQTLAENVSRCYLCRP
jgi:hypothetical protein